MGGDALCGGRPLLVASGGGRPLLQVRSLTLDEKVWERSVVALFEGLGNAHANAAWEENISSPHGIPTADASPRNGCALWGRPLILPPVPCCWG